MWLFLKGYVSLSLAAPSLSSPILNTLTISAAELFHGFRTFFMPPLTRGTLLARLGMLALPPGPLVPSPLCPLLLPLASSPRGERRRFALALEGCPLLHAASGPPRPGAPVAARPADGQHQWRLPALHFRRRRAHRRGTAWAEPRQLVLPAHPCAVIVGDPLALPLPVPARAPLLARLGVLACEAVFPSPRGLLLHPLPVDELVGPEHLRPRLTYRRLSATSFCTSRQKSTVDVL